MKPTTITEFRRLTGIAAEPKKQGKAKSKAAKGDAFHSKRSKLEDAFATAWCLVAVAENPPLPLPLMQFQFHPERKWRFDFCWPYYKLAIELNGGLYVRGGHSRGAQQEKDYEKQNAAVAMGWSVLVYGTKSMSKPMEVAAEVARILKAKGATK